MPKAQKTKPSRGVVVKDVDANRFIRTYAAYLKKAGKLEIPAYVDVVKLSSANELAPLNPDWFYIRTAAIARRVYLYPGVGVGMLARQFGTGIRRGSRPVRHQPANKGNIRHSLQQLEKLNIIEHTPDGGRKITKKRQKDLDRIAQQVLFPALKKRD
eukprot:NODE_9237_length_609_cov_408.450617_g8605_i0.p1 GENE.NODE_9237_length_609_cov_408.450617_g8605_i0~~NODE_9237_length_609_cov_408.450617_g8605_i0.p1  ORF type:complete len:157 (+),score=35.03 NODE_9237_length_609_cov_408.450617_g8605_i0:68-538(+)